MMLRRVKIWFVHLFPFRKPACSLLSCWSTVFAIRWRLIFARILLDTDSKLIPRQSLQLLRAPFFGIFTMTLSVQSSGNFFPSQMYVKSGWRTSAASCVSALNTSQEILWKFLTSGYSLYFRTCLAAGHLAIATTILLHCRGLRFQ